MLVLCVSDLPLPQQMAPSGTRFHGVGCYSTARWQQHVILCGGASVLGDNTLWGHPVLLRRNSRNGLVVEMPQITGICGGYQEFFPRLNHLK